MSLSQPVSLFGVHSLCLYNRTTKLPISYLRVLGDCNLDFTAEKEDLLGGSNLYPWDTEVTSINSALSVTAREYKGTAMELLLGGSLTENVAEASGAIADYVNVVNATVKDPTNGISSVDVKAGDEADLKEGKYIIVATAATVVSIYGTSDVDFKRGTDLTFTNDDLLIEASISVATTVDIEELGITLTVTGTPSMVAGDSAEFYIRKQNTGSIDLVFGQSGAEFQEVGVLLASQKATNGQISFIELYKVKGYGMPINFAEKAFSEWSIEMTALYDSVKDSVGRFTRSIPA